MQLRRSGTQADRGMYSSPGFSGEWLMTAQQQQLLKEVRSLRDSCPRSRPFAAAYFFPPGTRSLALECKGEGHSVLRKPVAVVHFRSVSARL
jgi:hypothetical protein